MIKSSNFLGVRSFFSNVSNKQALKGIQNLEEKKNKELGRMKAKMIETLDF